MLSRRDRRSDRPPSGQNHGAHRCAARYDGDGLALLAQIASLTIGRCAVTHNDEAVACQAARTASLPGSAGPARTAGPARRLWRWLPVGLLLIFSLSATTVYIATVTTDLGRHHWAGALDAFRAAVPAAVGWAAVLMILFARRAAASEGTRAADRHSPAERQHQTARAQDSVRLAEQRVHRLAAQLAELSAAAAEASQSQPLARQIGETAARLDQALQWLTGARAALAAATQPTVGDSDGRQAGILPRPGPSASRVALLLVQA